jgi:hypothetical protein
MDTQSLAVLESLFFGLGMVFFVSLIVSIIWLPMAPTVVETAAPSSSTPTQQPLVTPSNKEAGQY